MGSAGRARVIRDGLPERIPVAKTDNEANDALSVLCSKGAAKSRNCMADALVIFRSQRVHSSTICNRFSGLQDGEQRLLVSLLCI